MRPLRAFPSFTRAPDRAPGHPYEIENATIAAGGVSLTGLKLEPKKRTNYGFNSIRHRWGSNDSDIVPTSCRRPARSLAHRS